MSPTLTATLAGIADRSMLASGATSASVPLPPSNTGNQKLWVYPNGFVNIGKTSFSVPQAMGSTGGRIVIADWDAEGIVLVDTEGEITAEYL